jgi:hypothetical protein
MTTQDPPDPGAADASFGEGPGTAPEEAAAAAPEPSSSRLSPRWRLVRDLLIFQGKLAMDALRDLILSPVSIVAAVVGLIRGGDNPGEHFYEVMKWGRRSDHFINLFSAGRDPEETDDYASLDDFVDAVETVIVDEHKRGGVSAEAKAHFEKTLHRLEETVSPSRKRLSWRVRRGAVRLRQEARKVRDQITGPGASSS